MTGFLSLDDVDRFRIASADTAGPYFCRYFTSIGSQNEVNVNLLYRNLSGVSGNGHGSTDIRRPKPRSGYSKHDYGGA
jgi:hypothetical protein